MNSVQQNNLERLERALKLRNCQIPPYKLTETHVAVFLRQLSDFEIAKFADVISGTTKKDFQGRLDLGEERRYF